MLEMKKSFFVSSPFGMWEYFNALSTDINLLLRLGILCKFFNIKITPMFFASTGNFLPYKFNLCCFRQAVFLEKWIATVLVVENLNPILFAYSSSILSCCWSCLLLFLDLYHNKKSAIYSGIFIFGLKVLVIEF